MGTGRIAVIALAGLLASACSDGSEGDVDAGAGAGGPEAEAPYGEQAPVAGGVVAEALHVDTLGDGTAYLTDGAGRAVYVLHSEQGADVHCDEACTHMWPPLAAGPQPPSAGGEGVQAALIGTTERGDGTSQVTYAGLPLYHFHLDEAIGDTKGHDRTDPWGDWYLVGPGGERVTPPPPAGSTAEP